MKTLFKEERHARILELVNDKGQVTVPELSAYFRVSDATIRRDLEELDQNLHLRRTHGGAVATERVATEPPLEQRAVTQAGEKRRIGQAAAAMFRAEETVFLGSGTTVLEVARHIPEQLPLTVITNSLTVINELAERPQIELMVVGGMLRPGELSMIGHVAEQTVREFRADRVIIGMYAVHPQHGFTSHYPSEIQTDRAIMSIGKQVVVVVDHTKFGRVSSTLVAPITAAHLIITDRATPAETTSQMVELGVAVQRV